MLAKHHFWTSRTFIWKAISVPISGLVVTFASSIDEHKDAIEQLRSIPEIEIGQSSGGKLAIVVDTENKRRDQEIWNTVRDLPGVIDLAVAMVAFDEDDPKTEDDEKHHQGFNDE